MTETLIVLEKGQIQTYLLSHRSSWLIGRQDLVENIETDIVLSSRIASREHGWLRNIEGLWFYVDNPQNKNGTYHNEKKISRPLKGIRQPVMLDDGDTLRIDGVNHSDLGVVMLFLTNPVQSEWRYFAMHERDITIGSAKGCELIIQGFGLDNRQAKLTNTSGGYYLSACNTGVVFCNGQRIVGNLPLQYGDHIQINSCHFFFLGDKLIYTRIPKV